MSYKGPENEHLAKLRKLIKNVDICMLTTIDEEGVPHSRPMSTNGEVEFDGDLWFFTYGSSHKVDEVGRIPKVNASFSDPDAQVYVSMSGNAQLVKDRKKMEELWLPQLKAWFPKGLDEPDIALLKVNVEKAEYWDSSQTVVAHAVSLASSLITGQPAQPGVNKQLDFNDQSVRVSPGSGEREIKKHRQQSKESEGYKRYAGNKGLENQTAKRRSYFNRTNQKSHNSGLILLAGAGMGAAIKYLFDPSRR